MFQPEQGLVSYPTSSMATFTVRSANVFDAEALAEIKALSWKYAYAGFLPAEAFEHLEQADQVDRWRRSLADPAKAIFVAVTMPEMETVGYVIAGAAQSDQPAEVGEIQAIYIHPDYMRQGIGQGLMHSAAKWLREQGYLSAIVWAFEQNAPAIRFYERLGAVRVKSGLYEIAGRQLPDACLLFPSVIDLIGQTKAHR
jgi:ribosomal protein S18 acetylase RimI-like enzyme